MYYVKEEAEKVHYFDQTEKVEVSVPGNYYSGFVAVSEPSPLNWPDDFKRALLKPVGCPRLAELARRKKRVAIIVPDVTRGVPVAKILPLLLEELQIAGISLRQISVVIATGVHRPSGEAEIKELLGSTELKDNLFVINHNPYEQAELVSLGTTAYGTPVEINRRVYESDLRIIIGKVEPHEFAGFSGGRKSVLPGVASERAIAANHCPKMVLSPAACPGKLVGNNVSEDMMEAANLLGIDFTVNVVHGSQNDMLGIFTGALEPAHLAAVDFLCSFCQVELQEKPNIIVTTPGTPLNINLYQSVKAIIALQNILDKGDIIVFYAGCPDGSGTKDMFVPYKGAKLISDVIANLEASYKIQMDHALLLSKMMARGIRVIAITPNVEKVKLEEIMFSSADSLQEGLDEAINMLDSSHPRVLFYPKPQQTLPYLAGLKRS